MVIRCYLPGRSCIGYLMDHPISRPCLSRVRDRSGSLPKAKRWWSASEEATEGSHRSRSFHPLSRGSYSEEPDPAPGFRDRRVDTP